MKQQDAVFVLRGPDGSEEWKVRLDGRVLPVEWNSKGAAEAGLATERRRRDAFAKLDLDDKQGRERYAV